MMAEKRLNKQNQSREVRRELDNSIRNNDAYPNRYNNVCGRSSCRNVGEQMSDTGWKTKIRESQYNFLKWGEYMKRSQIAEMKVEKLKALLLLTDPAVSDVPMGTLTMKQWQEYDRWCEEMRRS